MGGIFLLLFGKGTRFGDIIIQWLYLNINLRIGSQSSRQLVLRPVLILIYVDIKWLQGSFRYLKTRLGNRILELMRVEIARILVPTIRRVRDGSTDQPLLSDGHLYTASFLLSHRCRFCNHPLAPLWLAHPQCLLLVRVAN